MRMAGREKISFAIALSISFLFASFLASHAQEDSVFPARRAFEPGAPESLVLAGAGTYSTVSVKKTETYSVTTDSGGNLVSTDRTREKEKVRTDRYDIALYLQEEPVRAALAPFQGGDFFDLLLEERIHRAILEADIEKIVLIRFIIDQAADDIRKDFSEQLGKSLSRRDESVVRFIKCLKADLKKDDEILIRATGRSKATISVCGSACGEFQSPAFIQALLGIWIGKDKLSSDPAGLLAGVRPLLGQPSQSAGLVSKSFVSSNAASNVSPDNRQMACILTRFGKQAVMANGKEGKRYDEVSGLVFSPDNRHMAYAARIGEKWFVVIDGKERETTCSGFLRISFSPDGQRLAYKGAAKTMGKWIVAVDWKEEEKEGDDIQGLTFSPNSRQVAYLIKRGDKWLAAVDEKEGQPHDRIQDFIFSPDGQHVAYIASAGREDLVILDGLEGKPYRFCRNLVFSPDGRHSAYVAGGKMGGVFAVVDGNEGKPYEILNRIDFSPDSQHVVYAGQMKGIRFLVVDGQESETPFSGIVDIVYSPDSQHMAYLATAKKGEGQLVVVDGIAGEKQYIQIKRGSLIFSPDSGHVAYAAKIADKWIAVVDGRVEQRYDDIKGIVFSPDSLHAAYAAKAGGKWFTVVGGKEGKPYDDLLSYDSWRIVFNSPDSYHYFAMRAGQGVFLVEDKISPGNSDIKF